MAANGLPEEDGGDFPRNNNASSDDEQHPESQLSMDPNLNNATNSPIMNNQEMDAENSSPTAETDDLSEEHPEVDSSDDDAENMGINANRQDEDKKLDRIADFTVGLQLDVLDSVGKWAEAEVLKVDQMRRQVYITYLYWADKWNEWVPIDSDRIAPLASQTYVEGKELQMGMRVEALDERHHWLEAEVVDIRVDQAKIHYRGWKHKYDEWVPRCPGVNNNKIRPFGRNKAVAKRKGTFRLKVKTLEEDNFRLQDKLEEADSKREDFQVELEKLVDENKKMRMENERLALELSKCQELIQQLGDEKREIKVENERLNLEVSMSQELNQQLAACNESIQAELKRTQESYQQKDVLGTLNELLEDQQKIQGIDDESMYKNIEDKLEEALTITRKAKEDYIRQSAVASFITNSKGNPDCVICMENPKEILVNPCKHFCLCLVCSDRVTNCPLCKQLIESKDRIFAS